MAGQRWRWVGERALLRNVSTSREGFRKRVFPANQRALALREAVADLAGDEVEDLVVGATSLLVMLRPEMEPSEELLRVLDEEIIPPETEARGDFHEIAVRYGGEDGPDLKDLARLCGLSERDVIEIHADTEYRVAFIGFSPGFPYLLGMPSRIETPRLETPRTKIPAGSVGIGGGYTGVYPRATPGGWRLIGRTDTELFDATRDPPALLAPGDRVRFVPV